MKRTVRELAAAVVSLIALASLGTAQEPGRDLGGDGGDYARGMALIAGGKPEQAVEPLRRASAQAVGPSRDLAQTGLAQAYRASGKAALARAALKGPIDRSGYAPALIEMARSYLYSPPFEPKKAMTYLKRVLTGAPNDVEALLELARAYLHDGSLESAIDVYGKLTQEIAPKDVRGWLGLASAHLLEKRFDKAKTAMRAALTLAPSDPEVSFRMGEMTMEDAEENGHVDKAIGWYERAIELGSTVQKYYGALIYAYYLNGNHLAAAPVLAALESAAPGSATARWAHGVFSEYQGRTADAARLYADAVATDPQSVHAHYSLGIILSGRRNSDFVVMGSDRDWKYLPHRNVEKAQAALRTALALDPAFPFATRARAILDELEATPSEPLPESPETREMKKKLDDYYKIRARLF